MANLRIVKFESELERLLNTALACKASDDRLSWVTITHVKLSPDMQFARIYFSYLEDEQYTPEDMTKILTRSSGFLKNEIAEAHIMRVIPQLTFSYDDTEKKAREMDVLLDKIKKDRRSGEES